MKRIKHLTAFFLVLLFLSQISFAEIRLPALVSSNMLLQRNTTVALWGWADPGENITISASWLMNDLEVTADADGNWKIEIETSSSKEQQTMGFKSEESDIRLYNILFGEVWLCSGQSNMQQPLTGYNGQPTFGAVEAIANSKNPNLRLFTVDRVGSKTPFTEVQKYTSWQEASPETVPEFSAVAYFFGQQLQQILDVPVGMIHTSWGGSRVEAWISNEVMSNFQEVDLEEVDITKRTNQIPTALFNSMINPLIPYTIKGALWYQGESNRLESEQYPALLSAMVKDWRDRWEIGEFPFYYVQIAPFMYQGDNDVFNTPENSAFIREAQLKSLDIIPNSGMAVTMDIGDDFCIHPPKKKEVADRLLYNALNQTYGYSSIDYSGPVYESHEVQEDGIVVKFKHAETGVFAYDKLEGFEIAGKDRVFYPAEAQVYRGRDVLVKSDKVSKPVAVRYAWRNWIIGTLYDTSLLPASSFRTDDWDDATRHNSVEN